MVQYTDVYSALVAAAALYPWLTSDEDDDDFLRGKKAAPSTASYAELTEMTAVKALIKFVIISTINLG